MDYGFTEWLERFRAVRAEGFRPGSNERIREPV